MRNAAANPVMPVTQFRIFWTTRLAGEQRLSEWRDMITFSFPQFFRLLILTIFQTILIPILIPSFQNPTILILIPGFRKSSILSTSSYDWKESGGGFETVACE